MTHKGFKVTTRNVRTRLGLRAVEVKIDGYYHWTYEGIRITREQAIAKTLPYIDAAIERPDAYEWTRQLAPARLAKKIAG